MLFLGIDTSNYTTSAALISDSGQVYSEKRLLPVAEGAIGVRQSDAVFLHTKALPGLLEQCFLKALSGFDTAPPDSERVAAVGVSSRPRDEKGSYMPCFLAGVCAGRAAALSAGAGFFEFSHQAGHAAAAAYSTGRTELLKHRFICFHFSGGTTDCLLVEPDSERVIKTGIIFTSSDLKAGQAVDRVGALLGLPFPAGAALSELGLCSKREFKPNPSFRGGNVSISGVENNARRMLENGEPREDIAAYCLNYIAAAAWIMLKNSEEKFGALPVLFAGGVMSSSYIRRYFGDNFKGSFCEPALSSDNAIGTAVLTGLLVSARPSGFLCAKDGGGI